MEQRITSFKQIKEIIAPIPKEKFCEYSFYEGDDSLNPDKCCFLGHIQHKLSGDPMSDRHGFGARQLTQQMLEEVHNLHDFDGTDVNNSSDINGYNEPEIKDRLMHMIEDGIKWEESKQN